MAKVNDNSWINKHLKFSIAVACNKSEDEITKFFLSNLRELNLSDQRIENLSGIEYAKSLTDLTLNNNNIKNANILGNLVNLKNLELSENRIEDLSFLSKLKKLKSIGLDYNNICTIPDLSNLKDLNLMNISSNRIQDFSFISRLCNKDVKIIASEQIVFLNPIYINQGDDYVFEPIVIWDDNNLVFYDNIQVTGKYSDIDTDERPSFLYSISKVIIKNIFSDCLIRADFFHDVPFFKSGILSGVIIQPIILMLNNSYFNTYKSQSNLYSITGRLVLNECDILNNKIVTIIDSEGNKHRTSTNLDGIYTFRGLKEDRYTLLFPFLSDYDYVTPSLYVINLKYERSLSIDAFLSSK